MALTILEAMKEQSQGTQRQLTGGSRPRLLAADEGADQAE